MRLLNSFVIAALCLTTPLMLSATPFTPAQVREVQKITRDYLVKNPEILREMAEKLQAEEKRKESSAMDRLLHDGPTEVRAHFDAYFKNPHNPSVGPANANVMLVEFFDYRCGHCRVLTPILDDIIKTHPHVKLIYKELPIFNGPSKTAALAALAANRQGQYAAFHTALMRASMPLNENKIMAVAKKVGLNIKQLKKDMALPALTQELDQNMVLAKSLLEKPIGYVFTPVIIVANKRGSHIHLIPGGASQAAIDEAIHEVQG